MIAEPFLFKDKFRDWFDAPSKVASRSRIAQTREQIAIDVEKLFKSKTFGRKLVYVVLMQL